MTPLPDDELISAVLDGEATAADTARVAADPVLSPRLEELRAVRGAVGAPVEPATSAARDHAIAAAMAAWPSSTTEPAAGTADTTPPPPPPADASRRRPRWLVPALAAAAVAAIVGIAVVANRGGDGTTTSTARDAAATTAASASGGAESAPSTLAAGVGTAAQDNGSQGGGDVTTAAGATTTAGGATTTAAGQAPAVAPGFLGALHTPEDVRATIAAVGSDVEAGPPATPISSCEAPATGARLVGIATWQGTPAYVFDVEGPPARALLLATLDCHLLVEVPLT